MKLLASGNPGSGHFRFLFADMVDKIPMMFEYDSYSNKWKSTVTKKKKLHSPDGKRMFLCAENENYNFLWV